jgi:hypothetical protein
MLFGLRADLVRGLTQQRSQQLGGTYPLPAVNPPGVHGMAHCPKHAHPSVDVDVTGIDQGATDVKQDHAWRARGTGLSHSALASIRLGAVAEPIGPATSVLAGWFSSLTPVRPDAPSSPRTGQATVSQLIDDLKVTDATDLPRPDGRGFVGLRWCLLPPDGVEPVRPPISRSCSSWAGSDRSCGGSAGTRIGGQSNTVSVENP